MTAPHPRRTLASRLPEFPWDSLASARELAASHADGIVDLSVGTPVDPTPVSVQQALADAADSHGYPTTIGTPALREGIVSFLQRHRAAPAELDVQHVLPTIGSKELVAHLPFQLGLGPGDAVAFPHVAYPTYDIGARLVGAQPLPVDMVRLAVEGEAALPDPSLASRIRLLWLNSPSNPTGAVLEADQIAAIVRWARERGIVVASDECYALLPWTVDEVPSVLDPRVNEGSLSGLLCVYSLSKQSNLAGYRAAFVAGDPALVGELLAVRKQAGMMIPGPIQAAMAAALDDDGAVAAQRETYRARRALLSGALRDAGGEIHGSDAGLYLWTTFREDCATSVRALAGLGILVAPGMFYGEAGGTFVRVALTATDERIAAAARRLQRH
ncbi:succinyldiaminopimelate transaminase [Brachybacterium muris]|uniref:succinyldiaminopimelate transaminase n=1 Tax=Brachybacterium muris TaxID=219301 RepID=UPI00195705B0|nr:succinyldiaminopimelate transaminase [Brachybacterium muris]MCT1431393.1 succinyldiaminopimelate transaminase [Brachybacterium muris]MCT2178375.1 succinyldiaminopimelate transaminase [Brachybacterium muris]MCT2296451.1 succinyldiaminopimelate transaminase [Brachybacterium muris]